MYVSSGATNNFNADSDAQTSTSSCGHTSYGSGWGDCGNYTWSSAPSPCANLGLDD